MSEPKCPICKSAFCNPEQLPGSKTPCMTCGQAYGQHCYQKHGEAQWAMGERARLVRENMERTGAVRGESSASEMMQVAVKCTGNPKDNS